MYMRKLGAAALAVALLASVASAQVQPAAPKLHARVLPTGTVRVTWAGVRASRDALVVVELERGAAADATTPLATLPPRPHKYLDEVPAPGVYWYRARVLRDTEVGPWSLAVMVTVAAWPTPTATPAPA